MTKKINFDLCSVDGNAFSLLGHFAHQARKEGWLDTEIQEVMKEARSGDYEHLVATLAEHCDYDDTEEEEDYGAEIELE